MLKVVRIIFLAFLFIFLSANWDMQIVGTYSWFYELKIGDGRNDGIDRIYASTYSGYLTEWTYNNGSWDMLECGHTTGGDTRIISIWIGEARNDGLKRIYAASANGTVYEFSFDNGAWVTNPLSPAGAHFAGITLGDSRNDGVERLIVGGWYNPLYEYSYESNSWSRQNVSPTDQYMWPMEIGMGRNDGIQRIYSPGWFINRIARIIEKIF